VKSAGGIAQTSRIALAVPCQSLARDIDALLVGIGKLAAAAAAHGSRLVVFPEFAATPGETTDDTAHDLALGQPVPGATTGRLGSLARECNLYLAIGLLERDHDRLYDSALLFDPSGGIALHYRRMQPSWHSPHSDPRTYGEGTAVATAATTIGRVAFAICGDLFDPAIADEIRASSPDLLLWLVSRCFADGALSQERWDREEAGAYAAAAAATHTTTCMVNRFVDPASTAVPAFGGGLVIDDRGTIVGRLPVGREHLLCVDVPIADRTRQHHEGCGVRNAPDLPSSPAR